MNKLVALYITSTGMWYNWATFTMVSITYSHLVLPIRRFIQCLLPLYSMASVVERVLIPGSYRAFLT